MMFGLSFLVRVLGLRLSDYWKHVLKTGLNPNESITCREWKI